MIANITVILYILSVSNESTNNGTFQKGSAISRTDNKDGYQVYNFHCYIPTQDDNNSDDIDEPEVIQPFKEDNVYLITGKFSTTQDNSLYITITTNMNLAIDKEDIPVSKPTAHLLGITQGNAELSETGYILSVQVKPYLSKDNFNHFIVNFTHPANGRFKNAFTKVKKNSTVYATGVLFIVKNKLYCEVLEFQFVSTTKSETDSNVTIPWKSKNDQNAEGSSSKPKSVIEKRIALIQQNETAQSSSATNSGLSTHKKRKKLPMTKLVNISKSLIAQDSENDDQQQKSRIEEIEDTDNDTESPVEEINEENTISTRTRNKKKKK